MIGGSTTACKLLSSSSNNNDDDNMNRILLVLNNVLIGRVSLLTQCVRSRCSVARGRDRAFSCAECGSDLKRRGSRVNCTH